MAALGFLGGLVWRVVTQELGVGDAMILWGPLGDAWVLLCFGCGYLDPSQGTAVYNCVRPEILCAVVVGCGGWRGPAGRGLC